MKRIMQISSMLAVARMVLLALPSGANAAPPPMPRSDVTFTFAFEAPNPDLPSGTITGCFQMQGTIRDLGEAAETYQLSFPEATPEIIAGTGTKILQGRAGTMVMSFTAQLYGGGLWGDAQWEILAGTGAYKKLQGSGTGTVAMVFPDDAAPYLAAEYTGSIWRDPSL